MDNIELKFRYSKWPSSQFINDLGHIKDLSERFMISSDSEGVPTKFERKSVTAHIIAGHALCVVARFCSVSFRV